MTTAPYVTDDATSETYRLMLGDSCERLAEVADNSVDLSIFSPPFASLFTYSPSDRDLGNSASRDEFLTHYRFIVDHLLRVTKPGRLVVVHCQQLATQKWRDGAIGLTDFRGDLIRAHIAAGFIFHGEVTIDKDPQAQAIRTKATSLMFVTLNRDSAMSRPAMADYLLMFRKPGDNVVAIKPECDNETWIEWARPVWFGIRETNTLNTVVAKESADERHICVASGTLVLTQDGYLPIEDVEVGIEVFTHAGRWMPVLAKRCNGIEPVIRSCAQGVAHLVTTSDHKFWTRRGAGSKARAQAKASVPEWVPASEVMGSYLNLPPMPTQDSALTENECWIIGRWLGDGHRAAAHRRSGVRGGTGQFVLSCSHIEAPGLLERLGDHAGAVHNPGTAIQINIRNLSAPLRDALARCGEGAAGKRVPRDLLALPQPKAEALLSGYLSADGHYVARHDRWMASSISRSLLLGMAIIAQRARGVVASVYAGRPERKHVIGGRVVTARQDWIFAFRNSPGYHQSGWIGTDGAWKKVRKSEAAGFAEVWDLQVAGDASFVAEGAAVKNCPLQLDLIERVVRLWSNRGETVLSPFAGIGSEGYVTIKRGRRFIGCELKPSYWVTAADNLRIAEYEANQPTLLGVEAAEVPS